MVVFAKKQFDRDAQWKRFARLNDTSVAREIRLKRQMDYQAQYCAEQSSQEKAERLKVNVIYQTAYRE